MVDSTQGVRPPQNIQSIDRKSPAREDEKRTEETRSSEPRDEVQISDEALSLSQVEQTTSDVRENLERDQDKSLGLDPSFDETV